MKVQIIFFLFLALWSYSVSASVSAHRTVCSMTINSSDEIEIFKEQLGDDDFDFIELVPLSEESRPNNVHWFQTACRQNYKCDVLVISGHFGGLFFGEENYYILPVEMLEQKACSRTCEGLLSNVTEVFLFGCNTLAGKNQDQRSPEEYLQVLLDHNMVRDMAETVVASRYLPYGLSFEEQMRMIFSGPTSIYGFSSLSPLGRDIRGPLRAYFQRVKKKYGTYSKYLDRREAAAVNPFLSETIGGSVREVKGLTSDDSDYSQFQKICQLYDEALPTEQGMELVQTMLETDSERRAFSAIKYFVQDRQPFTGKSLRIFDSISDNKLLSDSFYSLYREISTRLPYVRIQYLNFLNAFNWLTGDFYNAELRNNALSVISQPTPEAYDFVTALIYDEQVPLNRLLTVEDFPGNFYNSVWSPLIVEALGIRDYLMHRRLMNLCLSRGQEKPVICYQVLKSLGHLNVDDSLVVDAMTKLLNISHEGLIYYAMYGLSYAQVADPRIHQSIAQHLSHPDPWIQLQAVRTLGFLQSQDQETNQKMVAFLARTNDEEMIYEALNSLRQMAPSLDVLRKTMFDKGIHEHSNPDIRGLVYSF